MTDQVVLSDLCSICHVNVPQYRCPRCSCQTCSAQCVKRHKEWHQCSGRRDPTAKVSKSQLFTPAGIDHDYNFITSIERSRADLEARVPESKRIEGHSLRAGIASRNKNIQDRLDLTRVNIEWAPMGMSRQKLNQTRWSKNTRKIIWTVEWIHQDGDKELNEIHDSTPICREYASIFLKHNKVEGGRKRKRNAGLPKSIALPEPEKHVQENASLPAPDGVEFQKEFVKLEKADASFASVETAPNTTAEDIASSETPQPSDASNKPDPIAEEVKLQSHQAKTAHISELLRQSPGSPDDRGNYYYLVKPRTTGTEKVLIVLSPTDSLVDCLRDQTVLEFPSIQVLSNPPQSVPQGFILVNDYEDKFNKEQDEMRRLLVEAEDLEAVEVQQDIAEETLPPGLKKFSNADDIMATLERDVLERKGI